MWLGEALLTNGSCVDYEQLYDVAGFGEIGAILGLHC